MQDFATNFYLAIKINGLFYTNGRRKRTSKERTTTANSKKHLVETAEQFTTPVVKVVMQ
jgi:hypothetical protein